MTTVVIPAALAELKEQPRWVCWKFEHSSQGKLTKVPYQPGGAKASTSDPSTWDTYNNVAVAAGVFDGIGFVLTEGEIAAFDLDKCRDPSTGSVKEWAKALVARAATYSEITPSGTGLRIIGRGSGQYVHRKLSNGDGVNCEVYRKAKRYITVTGTIYRDAALADIDAVIDDFIAEFDGENRREAQQDSSRGSTDLPPSVASLLSVRGSGAYPSRSELLFAFITIALRNGVSDDTITTACLDGAHSGCGIYEHCQENGGLGYVERQVARARERTTNNQIPDPIITLADWLARTLEPPDFICGRWLTTTSRTIINAETGIGKTLFGIELGMQGAAGLPFLHWAATRPISVLYVDGEMARRVMQARLRDAVARLGSVPPPAGFHMLSHEDVQHWHPLNSPAGQQLIEAQIQRIGRVDLIVFDNIMSLISGDQKDELGWEQVMPWVRSLTRRRIAQVWLHHTGHDTTRGYGTKTREWQMDNVLHFEKFESANTDVSFKLTFVKAREREPATRSDFRDVKITLTNNAWTWEAQSGVGPARITALVTRFYEALCLATAASGRQFNGCPAATLEEWRAQCESTGLIDTQARPASARSLLSKNRLALISANWIASDATMVWTLAPNRFAGPL
jgi:hypothetical protein